MNDQKIAYILSLFPAFTETFIIREICEIRKQGLQVEVFSLKTPKQNTNFHKDAKELYETTNYLPYLLSITVLKALLLTLISKPVITFKILFQIITSNLNTPVYLLKTLAIFPKAITISRILKEKNINHVHAHWATIPTTAAWIISRLNNCDYTFTAHAWDVFNIDTMLEKKIQSSKVVITCTQFNKNYIISNSPQISPEKIDVIYHGLDLKKFSPGKTNRNIPFRILCIGRMSEKKGIHYLLKACSILRNSGLEFKCNIIYVPGNFEKTIYEYFSAFKLENYVKFIPGMPQEKLLNYYMNADCFVLPCIVSKSGDRDGIPNVILEALSMELPVVSTNVSGIPEVIQNMITGLLIEPEDENALASAIQLIYENKELSRTLGKNGRELIKNNFEISSNVEHIISVFHEQRER